MLLVVHALLNVVHNLRRTLAAVVIIALGTGLLFLSHAYLQGLYSILSFGIRNQTGDLQIHHADYDHASMTAQPLIPGDVLARVEQILAAGDFSEVRTISRELLFGGLFEAGAQSQGVSGVGLETDRLHRGSASRRLLVAGTDLKYGDDAHTILGEGVAKQVDTRSPVGRATVQVYTDSGRGAPAGGSGQGSHPYRQQLRRRLFHLRAATVRAAIDRHRRRPSDPAVPAPGTTACHRSRAPERADRKTAICRWRCRAGAKCRSSMIRSSRSTTCCSPS